MAFRDLLMGGLTYPDATPERALRSGVALAKRLGGNLTLAAVRIDMPVRGNWLSNAMLDLESLARREEARSVATAQLEKAWASAAAAEAHVNLTTRPITAKLYEEADRLCAAARTRDLCLLPIGETVLADRALAEAVLFGSGRPILVYPEAVQVTPRSSFRTVAIAWDGGAAAARAVADALPILRKAEAVRIFVATHEKPQIAPGIADDLLRHLKAHGVEAIVDEWSGKDEPIGRILPEYVASQRIDLLVMGGFGHARVREFILGGATASVLQAPPCPVLMSH